MTIHPPKVQRTPPVVVLRGSTPPGQVSRLPRPAPAAARPVMPRSQGSPSRIKDLVILAGLAAFGLRCLPAPVGLGLSIFAPPVFLASRICPGLRPWLVAACVLCPDPVLVAAALATGEGLDWGLACAACASSAPLQLRLMTWRSRIESWDLLDPLVILTAPVAFTLDMVVVVRMFEIPLLSWS